MSYLDTDQLTAYTTTWKPCSHKIGWFFTVKFWIFSKRLFWCELYKKAIPERVIKELLNASEEGGV